VEIALDQVGLKISDKRLPKEAKQPFSAGPAKCRSRTLFKATMSVKIFDVQGQDVLDQRRSYMVVETTIRSFENCRTRCIDKVYVITGATIYREIERIEMQQIIATKTIHCVASARQSTRIRSVRQIDYSQDILAIELSGYLTAKETTRLSTKKAANS
jgi:hypothetical protein